MSDRAEEKQTGRAHRYRSIDARRLHTSSYSSSESEVFSYAHAIVSNIGRSYYITSDCTAELNKFFVASNTYVCDTDDDTHAHNGRT